jgi:hypothetical protein
MAKDGGRSGRLTPGRVVQRAISVVGLVVILVALVYALLPFKVQVVAPPAPKEECRPAAVQVFDRKELLPPPAPGQPPGPPITQDPNALPSDPQPDIQGVPKPCTAEAEDRLYWTVPVIVIALIGMSLARRFLPG